MPSAIRRASRVAPPWLKAAVKAIPIFRNLTYDGVNVGLFTNLWRHELMLSDGVRMSTYRQGIERHVAPGSVVLDLGTGTGVLAVLASRRGPRRVFAIDHSPFIATARAIAARNGATQIEFIQENSRTFVAPEPVDLILHEQMGDELLNENMLVNLLDLKRRVLRPGGRIQPARFDLYLEPISLLDSVRVPTLDQIRIDGFDLSFANELPGLDAYRKNDYNSRLFSPGLPFVQRFLTEQQPFLSFDLNQLASPDEVPRTVNVRRVASHPGVLDGFCLYFRCAFDDDIAFDTSPASTPTHWANRFFRCQPVTIQAGTPITYSVAMPDFTDARTWSVALT